MVEDFADQCRATSGNLTVTGSWLNDRLQLPGFWEDVYLKWEIDTWAEERVEKTLGIVDSASDTHAR